MRIDLKTGFACNNRCAFCVQGERRRHLPRRPLAELVELLRRGRELGDEVVLTGGEVTLRDDVLELVAEAAGLGYRVIQLQSNGRRFASRAFCEAVIAAGATEFGPALHGATAATHDALTRAPGSFRQTLRGIRNLVALGQTVLTNSVACRPNLPELPRLAELLAALGVSQLQVAMVHPLGSAARSFRSIVPRLDEAAPWVRAALRIAVRAGVPAMAEAMPACLLGPFGHLASELRIPPTRIEDPEHVVADFRAARVREGKAKGPACAACTWNDACEGPWREYADAFGWDALRPRSDAPPVPLAAGAA